MSILPLYAREGGEKKFSPIKLSGRSDQVYNGQFAHPPELKPWRSPHSKTAKFRPGCLISVSLDQRAGLIF
jgi:hypothetical protein